MTRRTLLVATPGGHIEELFELASRLDLGTDDRLWVTSRTAQTSRILRDERAHWVQPVGSRQGWRAVAALPGALALLRSFRPDLAISTGAALAVPYLAAARAVGAEVHYVESATRFDGPSMTGRLLMRLPGAHLHHQGFRDESPRWHALGSVFDGFRPGPATTSPVRRVVVTLGTERYPFPRALEQVRDALPTQVEALVQTGNTPPLVGLPSRPWVPADELHEAVRNADLVIMHAGVGSVLSALRCGKHPVILPRLASLGEHIDDHQRELAVALSHRGLATVVNAGDDLAVALTEASRRTTVRAEPRAIRLSLRGE